MDDWLTLQHPQWIALLSLVGIVCVLLALAGGGHPWRVRLTALALRLTVLAALCLLVAQPVVEVPATLPSASGVWRLHLEPQAGVQGPNDYDLPPVDFAAKLRDALVAGVPPARVEIVGQGAEADYAQALVQELAVEVARADLPQSASSTSLPQILAPYELQPGEPLRFSVDSRSPVRVYLNRNEVQAVSDHYEIPALTPGRHVIEAELSDANGQVTHRVGHVLSVGTAPRLLLLGLDDPRAAEVQALAANFECVRAPTSGLTAESLQGVGLVLASIQALDSMGGTEAFTLATFVARGGGLFVTGDGARHVAPGYLPADLTRVLPVTLLPEPTPEVPPKPPVEEKPIIADVARVSVCYLLDRSGSMATPIGDSGLTRWQVAVKGVSESMTRLTLDSRALVMAFTLKQNWLTVDSRTGQPQGRIFLAGNREELARALSVLPSDDEYDSAGFNTDIYAAVKAAIEAMEREPSAVKLIIMMTDGADRWANDSGGLKHSTLRDLAESKGINIISIGIGEAFAGGAPEAVSARKVITDLATRPRHDPRASFAFLPSSPQDAARAHTIFVSSVETAFELFDQKKQEEEKARARRMQEEIDRGNEPPRIDTPAGMYPVLMLPAGLQLFGPDVLTVPSPRAAWYARHKPRPGAAQAIGLQTDDGAAALTLGAHGLGRVAFWSAGTDPESLGEVAAWDKFPAMFAATLRWLAPRDLQESGQIRTAGPGGIRLAELMPGATHTLQRLDTGERVPLLEVDGLLVAGPNELDAGPVEVLQTLDGTTRSLGTAYVAMFPFRGEKDSFFRQSATPASRPGAHSARPLRIEPARETILYLVAMVLIVLPLERWARRRT